MNLQRFLGGLGLGVLMGAALVARRVQRLRRRIDFADRVAVITGGSRGLGLLVARELVGEGARVTLVARTAGDLDMARADLRARTDQSVEIAIVDVADADQLCGVIRETAARQCRLDILINCAGTIQVGPLEHAGPEMRTGWDSRSRWAPSVLVHRADRVVAEHNELRGHSVGELRPSE